MICFIVNPIAGKGRSVRIMEQLDARLNRERIPHDVRYSIYAGHATGLTREAVGDGYKTIVAVGGDGSIGEIAAGLLDTGAQMGIIPGGSGNDYRRCLGIPKDPMKAMDVILGGYARPVDAIEANGRLFMNIVNVGFSNEVACNADRYKRLGELAYLLGVFYTISRNRPIEARFTLDGKVHERPVLLMDIGCGTHLGGGMKALPDADPFDGLLDVCYIDHVSPGTIIRLLPKYISGKHMSLPIAHHCRCRQVTLEGLNAPVSMGGDGDNLGALSAASFRILPGAVSMLVPSPQHP